MKAIRNVVSVLAFAAGLALAYSALAPVTPRPTVGHLDVPETVIVGDAAPVITVPEVTIVGTVARRAVQTPEVSCTHRGYLGGESWTCGGGVR
jgi:hypothetical protein